jgi:hypothetical protein
VLTEIDRDPVIGGSVLDSGGFRSDNTAFLIGSLPSPCLCVFESSYDNSSSSVNGATGVIATELRAIPNETVDLN